MSEKREPLPWVKLWRKMLDNDWLNEKPERFAAWTQIFTMADDDTGLVELTRVPARRWFSRTGWRRFCYALAEQDMIEGLSITNAGGRQGQQLIARVVNHDYYQGRPRAKKRGADGQSKVAQQLAQHRPSKRRSNDPSSTEEVPNRGAALGAAVSTANGAANDSYLICSIRGNTEGETPKDIRQSGLEIEPAHTRGNGAIDYQEFADVYNQNAGLLPRVHRLNDKRRRGIKRLVKELGYHEALVAMGDATKQVAADDFWVERGYNFDNLVGVAGRVVEKAEKWAARGGISNSNARFVANAAQMYRALGPMAGEDE